MPPQIDLIRSQRAYQDPSASKRHAAPTSRTPGQQNDIQRQPRGSSASKPPQEPRQANDSGSPEDPCPANEPERQLLTSPKFHRRLPTKRPSHLRLEVLFVSLLTRLHLYKIFLCHHRLIRSGLSAYQDPRPAMALGVKVPGSSTSKRR